MRFLIRVKLISQRQSLREMVKDNSRNLNSMPYIGKLNSLNKIKRMRLFFSYTKKISILYNLIYSLLLEPKKKSDV